MKRICWILSITMALLTASAAGAQADASGSAPPSLTQAAPESGHPSSREVIVGKVTETMDAGRYTYVEVDTGDKRVWAAGPQVQVKVGDSVYFPDGVPKVDFESKSLGRKFDVLYMVDAIRVASSATASSSGGTAVPEKATGSARVEPVAGGYTVAQVFERRTELAGRQIDLRGRVVKFNGGILGRNWVHVQDGTVGPGGANDLVVTTNAQAAVGSIVLVHGTVVTNKDFGSGYTFDVLIEEASLSAK